MFFIFNPTYLLVLHFFKLQALQIELSRPGGGGGKFGQGPSTGFRNTCAEQSSWRLNLALQAARPRICGSQTAGGGPVWSRYWALRPGLLIYQYQSWDFGDNVG